MDNLGIDIVDIQDRLQIHPVARGDTGKALPTFHQVHYAVNRRYFQFHTRLEASDVVYSVK